MYMRGLKQYQRTKLIFKKMIVSNEPAVMKNKFGIRIENLIYVKSKRRIAFENLTINFIEKI